MAKSFYLFTNQWIFTMNRLTSKLSIIILYYVKLFTTLHNLISSLYKYIYDKYIYIYIYI